MKTTAYVSLIYGLVIILSGIMAFRFENSFISFFVEIGAGIIILGNVFFMIKEKTLSFYVLLILSFLLAIFYGYNFYKSYQFFPGLLTAISFFVFVYELLKIFKIFKTE